jgi:hypothetical protein
MPKPQNTRALPNDVSEAAVIALNIDLRNMVLVMTAASAVKRILSRTGVLNAEVQQAAQSRLRPPNGTKSKLNRISVRLLYRLTIFFYFTSRRDKVW